MSASFDFSTAARSGGVITAPPAWLTLTCATTDRSAMQSASTTQAGLGANAARVTSHDGATFGLLIESVRRNYLLNSLAISGTGWTEGAMAAVTGQADPSGGTSAIQFTSAGNQYSNYQDVNGGNGQTLSVWAKGISGSTPYARVVASEQAGNPYAELTENTWTKIYVTMPVAGGLAYCDFETRNIPVGAGILTGTRVFFAYGMQYENGKYPSSTIHCTAASVTRDADVARVPSALFLPRGEIHRRMTFSPLYASPEFAADHNILFADADNRLYLRQADKAIVLRVGAVDRCTSAALTFARNTPITVQFASSAKLGSRLSVNGVASANAAWGGAIPLPASVGLLGGATTEECAVLGECVGFNPRYREGLQ